MMKKLKLDLASAQSTLQVAESNLAATEILVTRWRNALAVLDQLQAMSADPNPHVAALVCDRTPKAPNPDPALFH
jgi:anti-sigma-K factor RskA